MQTSTAPASQIAAPTLTGRTWNEILGPYKGADIGKSLFQLTTTSLAFVAGWYLMYRSLEVSYLLTLLLSLPVGGLMIRLFIIQHDCGHGSFFRSAKANNAVGFALGVVTLMPYHYWRRTHAIHHATSGDLDRRDLGEIETLTVDEYLARSRWGRLAYRIYRNMFVMLVIGPVWQFVIKHRLPLDAPFGWRREWAGVMWTNVALAATILGLGWAIGFKTLLLVHAPVILVTGAVGIWLFYVQHQFEDTYWENTEGWDFHRAGIEGSSFLDMPRVLHWFTGNIGYHHVHHLSSRIPNYKLRRCLEENPELHKVTRLTLREALGCSRLKLWDEEARRMVGFSDLRERRRTPRAAAV